MIFRGLVIFGDLIVGLGNVEGGLVSWEMLRGLVRFGDFCEVG